MAHETRRLPTNIHSQNHMNYENKYTLNCRAIAYHFARNSTAPHLHWLINKLHLEITRSVGVMWSYNAIIRVGRTLGGNELKRVMFDGIVWHIRKARMHFHGCFGLCFFDCIGVIYLFIFCVMSGAYVKC